MYSIVMGDYPFQKEHKIWYPRGPARKQAEYGSR